MSSTNFPRLSSVITPVSFTPFNIVAAPSGLIFGGSEYKSNIVGIHPYTM
jgi:hypothetical protein